MTTKVAPHAPGEVALKKPVPLESGTWTHYDQTYLKRRAEVKEGFVTVKSGNKYFYFTDGAVGKNPADDDVPIVLTLHGMQERCFSFMFKEPLEGIFQIGVDRLGHGLSSNAPPAGWSFADGCGELMEVVDGVFKENNIPLEKKFFVAGHSMGGTWTIELAACPDTRDRILAIAPISAPTDLFHPRVEKSDKKHIESGKNYEGLGDSAPKMLLGSGCFPCLFRKFMFHKLMFPCRPSIYKSGDKKYLTDENGQCGNWPMWKKHALGSVCGDPFTIKAFESDLFNLTRVMDNYQSLNSKHDAISEFARCWALKWSYDMGEITVPCFLYCGQTESMGERYQDLSKKLIGDNAEVIPFAGAGHGTVSLAYRVIIEALVKKEKASAPFPEWNAK